MGLWLVLNWLMLADAVVVVAFDAVVLHALGIVGDALAVGVELVVEMLLDE